MAQKITLKRSSVQGNAPSVTQLDLGELAINTYDGNVFLNRSTTGNQVDGTILNLVTNDYTGNVSITGAVTATSLQLTGGALDQGTLSWNTDEETLDLIQNGAVLQIGQEIHYHVRNNTVGTITNGTPVMATGTIGASGRLTVAPMDGTNIANAKFFIGIATEDITADTDGKITHFGKVRGIDTSATGLNFAEGDVVWISTTVAGGLTNVEPTSGMKLPIAFCVSSANNGTIFVRSTNGHALHESNDVNLTSLASGDFLKYNGTNWINTSIVSSEVSYNNTTSGLTAADVQAAIDELDSTIDTLSQSIGGDLNIDGGNATSTYVPAAVIDGGGA